MHLEAIFGPNDEATLKIDGREVTLEEWELASRAIRLRTHPDLLMWMEMMERRISELECNTQQRPCRVHFAPKFADMDPSRLKAFVLDCFEQMHREMHPQH